jgi:hypothetical protein
VTSRNTKRSRDARYRGIRDRREWSIIETAKQELVKVASVHGISIHSLHYVATFEDWDQGIDVWVFFKDDSDLRQHKESGATSTLEAAYLRILRRLSYPFEKFPDVRFHYDSDENVRLRYEGSYFNRLR